MHNRDSLRQKSELARLLQKHMAFRVGGRLRRLLITVVGSLRRATAKAPRDVDLLVQVPDSAKDIADVLESGVCTAKGAQAPVIARTVACGTRKRSCVVRWQGRAHKVDFFLARAAERPFALMHFTGSAAYNIRVRAHAKARGWRLNQYGVFEAGGSSMAPRRVRGSSKLRTEKELAAFLGVSWHPPAARI